jgi:hypothetical protein
MGDDDRRGLSPLFWTHINPYGRFRLDMETRLDLSPPRKGIGDTGLAGHQPQAERAPRSVVLVENMSSRSTRRRGSGDPVELGDRGDEQVRSEYPSRMQ